MKGNSPPPDTGVSMLAPLHIDLKGGAATSSRAKLSARPLGKAARGSAGPIQSRPNSRPSAADPCLSSSPWRALFQPPRQHRRMVLDGLRAAIQPIVPKEPIGIEVIRAGIHFVHRRAGGLEGDVVRLFPLIIAGPAAIDP